LHLPASRESSGMARSSHLTIAGSLLVLTVLGSSRAWADDVVWETDHDQVTPLSPVAGGNDPNLSDDPLYILEEEDEDFTEIQRDQKGILRQNGRSPGRGQTRRTHVLVNPSLRVAAKKVISPQLTLEAFATSGLGSFRESTLPFGTRATNVAGGMTATANLGFVTAVFGFEHRQAYANTFEIQKAAGDKLGLTLSRTFPLFVPQLSLTPQFIASRESVSPINASISSLEALLGATYKLNERISFAASAGGTTLFLFGLPGRRHDDGIKLSFGTTIKVTDDLLVTVGALTNRTTFEGISRWRAERTLSPSVNLRYTFAPTLSASLTASYGRFLSTVSGNSTFKYNLNPNIALTVPL
jgi:hypothetical protein